MTDKQTDQEWAAAHHTVAKEHLQRQLAVTLGCHLPLHDTVGFLSKEEIIHELVAAITTVGVYQDEHAPVEDVVEPTDRPIKNFYVHHNGHSWFVKTEEMFLQQGGDKNAWGSSWRKVNAYNVAHARATAKALYPQTRKK